MVTIPGCDRRAARSFRFPEETLAILAFLFRRLAGQRNGLYRDHSIDLGIARFVDNTHGSPSQLGQDLVSPKTFVPAIIHKCHLRLRSFRVAEVQGCRVSL